jgi:hypothetical protein
MESRKIIAILTFGFLVGAAGSANADDHDPAHAFGAHGASDLARETPSYDRGGSRDGGGGMTGGVGADHGGRDIDRGRPTAQEKASHEGASIPKGQDKPGSSVGVVHDIPKVDGVNPVGAVAKDVRVDTLQRTDGSTATTVRSSSDKPSLSATSISQPPSREQPAGSTAATVGVSAPLGGPPASASHERTGPEPKDH